MRFFVGFLCGFGLAVFSDYVYAGVVRIVGCG